MIRYLCLIVFLGSGVFAKENKVDVAVVSKKKIEIKDQESQVEFIAIGKPSLLKINGKGGKMTGKVEIDNSIVSGNFVVPLGGLTTGIDLRDEHMRNKYLQTDKFPNAELQISELKLEKSPMTSNFITKGLPFKGKLKIHDTESDVEGNFDIESMEHAIVIKAKTKTSIAAHKIDIPSYVGIKVADEVEINVDLKIVK